MNMIIISYPRYEGESWEGFVLQLWRESTAEQIAQWDYVICLIWAVSADRDN